jgi:nucleoside-diphosphate-sugar epimerase
MKRVLLTGATGFIGRQCIDPLLSRGFEVHAITHGDLPREARDMSWHSADMMNPDQVRAICERVRASHLLHMAWSTEAGKFWTSPDNLRWVAASADLVRNFQAAGGERIVAAGSCAEYDWSAGECAEATTSRVPGTLYGACKDASRRVLESFTKTVAISHAWGQIFFLFGPYEPPGRLVPAVIRALLRGEPARCTCGIQVRDFMHSSDVGDAFAALLDSVVTGPVNVASGDPMTIRALVERIQSKMGGFVEFGALALNPGDPAVLTASVTRLRHEVGWKPRLTIDAALDDTIRWWRTRQA